ncbi:hypothetical protein M405DRAFT_807198, partial [Rhizopogon salebrosus TDB-379]
MGIWDANQKGHAELRKNNEGCLNAYSVCSSIAAQQAPGNSSPYPEVHRFTMTTGPSTSSVAKSRRPPAFAFDRLHHHLSRAHHAHCPVHYLHRKPPRTANPFLQLSVTLADTHMHSSKTPFLCVIPTTEIFTSYY